MKKLLFLIAFAPSISFGTCSTFTYILEQKPAGYAGTKYYVCDTDADKAPAGLTMGEKAYIKDTNIVYFATSSTGWVPQVSITTEVTNVRGLKWSDGSSLSTTTVATYPLSSVSLNYSSAAASYLGISSSPALSPTAVTYSSASVSYLGISSVSVDSLQKSSAAVSYVGISTITSYLLISSQAASNVVNQGQYMFTSSQSASNLINQGQYLPISSQSASNLVNQGQYVNSSSAAVSYLGISTAGTTTSFYTAYGGLYTMTATTNTIAVGASSVTVTIPVAGTYLLLSNANFVYNAATFAASQVVTMAIYRQNNTPGVVTNALVQGRTRIITTITDEAGTYEIPPVIYVTTNANDVLSLHGSVTVVPSAGSLQANKACLVAVRLK